MFYEELKTVVKKIIPKQILFNYEQGFRKAVFIFYRGRNYQCPICQKKLRAFIQLKTADKLCPNCGSLDRHRRLWTLLQPLLQNGIKVLDFSPPRCLYKKLKSLSQIEYTSTDFADEFPAEKKLDITQLDLTNESYDLIICYHVLEHVEKDVQAMHELFRVLKPNGFCFIQTPFKEGNSYENFSIKDPIERKKHFGQEDHVRIYSIEDLTQRLQSVGFLVEQLNFCEEKNNFYGFHEKETVVVAKK